jgi:hypothetical protein
MSDDDRSGDRDEVADAIRARQSLENDIELAGEELGPGFTGGERLGALGDFEETDGDEALDDDDVENSGDK